MSISLSLDILSGMMVRPIFLCGSDCWRIRKQDEKRLCTTEMRWLQKIAGISKSSNRNDNTGEPLDMSTIIMLDDVMQQKSNGSFVWKERPSPTECSKCKTQTKRSSGRLHWIDIINKDISKKTSTKHQKSRFDK